MKKISLFLLSLVFVLTLSISVAAATMTEEEVIKTVVDNNVMQGTGNGFEPGKTLTRAEITTIVVRLKGLEEESIVDVDFDDINSKYWGYKYIAIAYREGIVKGVGDNKFAPDREVTIGEAVTMILRAVSDVSNVEGVGTWPDNYMKYAKELKIMTGVTKAAGEKSTRIDTARLVANILTSKDWAKEEEKKPVEKARAKSGIILEVADAGDGINLLTLAMPGGTVEEYETDSSELAAGTILPGTLVTFWLTDKTMWDIDAEAVCKVPKNKNVIKVLDKRDNLIKCIIKKIDDDGTVQYKSSDFEWLPIGNILYLKAEELNLVGLNEKDADQNDLFMRSYKDLAISDGNDIEYVDDLGDVWDKIEGTEFFYHTIKDKDEDIIVAMIYTDED